MPELKRDHFFFGLTVFLLLFTFIAGIALAVTNQLAIGLSLLISNVLTTITCTLLLYFNLVTFPSEYVEEDIEQKRRGH